MMSRCLTTPLVILMLSWIALAQGAPTITSFTPIIGTTNDQVTITGTGFSPGTLTVRYGGASGAIDHNAFASTAQQINSIVPTGAVTGKISVQVGVSSTLSAANYTVIGNEPYVTNFTPIAAAAGQMITLQGLHFGNPSQLVTNVTFNGVRGNNLFVQTENILQIDVPTGAITGPLIIYSKNGTRFSTATNTLSSATNFYVTPPIITGFSPAAGTGGTNILITGTNLLGASDVQINGSTVGAGNFIVLSNDAIQATIPVMATTGPIGVTVSGSTTATSSNFVVRPLLLGFSPFAGPTGTVVTVTGQNLWGATHVQFTNGVGNVDGAIQTVAFSSITVKVPTTAVTGPIVVVTTNGTSSSGTNFFLPPILTSFNPTNSPPGSIIQIAGNNFLNTSAVLFNGLAASNFSVLNNATINAGVPAGVTTGPISVTGVAGSATNLALVFYGAPIITGFTPSHGLSGTNVLITGTNLLNMSKVLVAGYQVSPLNATNNGFVSVAVPLVPASVTNGPITVIGPAGTSITTSNFTFDVTANLDLTIAAAPSPVFVTSNLVYTVATFNGGPFDAPNVIVTNLLPGSVNLISAVPGQGSVTINGSQIVGNLGTIPLGSTANITITVVPQVAGSVTNTATARTSVPDPVTGDNSNTVVTTVWPLAVLNIRPVPPNQVRISWPAALNSFTLQSNPSLIVSNGWSAVPGGSLIIGNESVVTQTVSGAARFFRLKE